MLEHKILFLYQDYMNGQSGLRHLMMQQFVMELSLRLDLIFVPTILFVLMFKWILKVETRLVQQLAMVSIIIKFTKMLYINKYTRYSFFIIYTY